MCLVPKLLFFSLWHYLYGEKERIFRKMNYLSKELSNNTLPFVFLSLLLFVHSFSPGPHFHIAKNMHIHQQETQGSNSSQRVLSANTEVRKPLWMVSSFSMPVTEISSLNTYISRVSMPLTSKHHTQPLPLQRDAPGEAEHSRERVQGPDNTPTKTQGSQESTWKFFYGQKMGVEWWGKDPNSDRDEV